MIDNNDNDGNGDGNEDAIPIEVSAALELSEPAVEPEPKRGFASLRGVKRSVYMRRSLLKVLTMSPEELAAFKPQNGFQELAKALVEAPSKGKDGAVVIAVWREVRSTLGERTDGPNGRARREQHNHIVMDLPQPGRA